MNRLAKTTAAFLLSSVCLVASGAVCQAQRVEAQRVEAQHLEAQMVEAPDMAETEAELVASLQSPVSDPVVSSNPFYDHALFVEGATDCVCLGPEVDRWPTEGAVAEVMSEELITWQPPLAAPVEGEREPSRPILWCSRADDPRCAPAAPTPDQNPSLGSNQPPVAPRASFAIDLRSPPPRPLRDHRSRAETREGIRRRVERPPRS